MKTMCSDKLPNLEALAQVCAEAEPLRTNDTPLGQVVTVAFIPHHVKKRKRYMSLDDFEWHDGVVVDFVQQPKQRKQRKHLPEHEQNVHGVKTMLWVWYPGDHVLVLHDAYGMCEDGLWQWRSATDA